MSTLAEIEAAILGLPPQDKLQLVTWLDEHSEELTPLSESQRAELRRRSQELVDHPKIAQPFEPGYFDRLRQKVSDVRTGKASAG